MATPTITPGRTAWETRQYNLDHGRRAGYAAGLRALAGRLAAHEELPLPVDGNLAPLGICFAGPDAEDRMNAAADVLALDWTPTFTQAEGGIVVGFDGHLEGLRIRLLRYLEAPVTLAPEHAA